MYSTPNELFTKHLLPAYPRGWIGTVKGDLVTAVAKNHETALAMSPIKDADQRETIRQQIIRMRDVGLEEMQSDQGLVFARLDEAIEKIDHWYDRARIDALIEGDPTPDESGISDVFIRTVEIAAILGSHLIELDPSIEWCPVIPYWESPLFHSKSGTLVNVYHWSIKRFTDYGIDDGLIGKCQACIGVLSGK